MKVRAKGAVSKGFGSEIFSRLTPKNEEESDLLPLRGMKWAHFRDGITADIPFETASWPWATASPRPDKKFRMDKLRRGLSSFWRKKILDLTQAHRAVTRWIEDYHTIRIHRSLHYGSPQDIRTRVAQAQWTPLRVQG